MRARAEITVAGRISDAEALWYDTSRWPSVIDGFHHVASVDDGWPASGSLIWDSTPGGRGRVMETVDRYEARSGQTTRVQDAKITAVQTVTFTARPADRVAIRLELDYELSERRGGPLFTVVDAIFIRPRQREALARTLVRFARELADDRAPDTSA